MTLNPTTYWKNHGLLRKTPAFQTQGVRKTPSIPPPEAMHWYWSPSRVGVKFAPGWFLAQLHTIDPDLTVTWDVYNERWLVWMRNERFNCRYSQGWLLLFPVRYADGSYMPLDERIFARLFAASTRKWGRGKDYFLAIEREMERDREKVKRDRDGDVRHAAGEYYDHMKIQTSMCGPSNGSKFSDHFAG